MQLVLAGEVTQGLQGAGSTPHVESTCTFVLLRPGTAVCFAGSIIRRDENSPGLQPIGLSLVKASEFRTTRLKVSTMRVLHMPVESYGKQSTVATYPCRPATRVFGCSSGAAARPAGTGPSILLLDRSSTSREEVTVCQGISIGLEAATQLVRGEGEVHQTGGTRQAGRDSAWAGKSVKVMVRG